MTTELTFDPACPGGDKTVKLVIVGAGRPGKTWMRMVLLEALAKGQVVLFNPEPGELLQGNQLRFRTAHDIPPAPPATPFWSADHRSKRGRR